MPRWRSIWSDISNSLQTNTTTLEHRRSRLRPDARYGWRLSNRWYPVFYNKKMTKVLQILDILHTSAVLPLTCEKSPRAGVDRQLGDCKCCQLTEHL